MKEYVKDDLVIMWKPEKCIHAGKKHCPMYIIQKKNLG